VLYVLQTAIPLDKQQAIWTNLNLPEGVVISLLRDDGYQISRLPMVDPAKLYSAKHPNRNLLALLQTGVNAGYFTGASMDGVERFGAVHHLNNYPLYALISVSTALHRQIWWRSVQFPVYMLLG